jgi:hypothetical protein
MEGPTSKKINELLKRADQKGTSSFETPFNHKKHVKYGKGKTF